MHSQMLKYMLIDLKKTNISCINNMTLFTRAHKRCNLWDFRLPLRCSWGLHFRGILHTALVGASRPVLCEDPEEWSTQELYCLFVIFIIHNHSGQIGVVAYTGDGVLQWRDSNMSHFW